MSVEKNVEGELAKPLIIHYQKLRSGEQRMAMLSSLTDAFDENEDVVLALSNDVFKALLNFLLVAFSHEKELLEQQSNIGQK